MTARLPYAAELVVERELNGVRIDTFLIKHFRNYTPWRMQRIVRAGGAAINQAPAVETDRVFEGQTVFIRLLEPPDKLLAADPGAVLVLFEDPWLVVVNKPAGIIAHPTGEYHAGSLANLVQHWLDDRTPLRGLLRPGLVHRLDRQTSGVVVLALHHLAHRRLAEAFEDARVQKTYLALVEGEVRNDSGSIDLPIGRTPTGRQILMSACGDALDARPARTRYEVVQRFGHLTLVRAFPATGRNHQIRVHFAQIGHPLVGDEFYEAHGKIKPLKLPVESDRDDDDSREVETGLPIRRHALHAERLCFAHPITRVWMEFVAPLPPDFAETIALLRCSAGKLSPSECGDLSPL